MREKFFRSKFGFIPFIPYGATLGSVIASTGLTSTYTRYSRATTALLGMRCPPSRFTYMGRNVRQFALAIGAGPFKDSRSILQNFTLWPLHAYVLPEAIREAWSMEPSPGKHARLSYYLKGGVNRPLAKPMPHLCLSCVAEDLKKLGVAYWRVYHQIPCIDHCPYHRELTLDHCSSCGAFFSTRWTLPLPSLHCNACGEKLFSIEKPKYVQPYWNVLSMLADLFRGGWSLLSPESRLECYKKFSKKFDEIDEKEKIIFIAEYLKDTWQAFCLKELCKRTGAIVSTGSIARALSGADSICDPMLHLMLLEACNNFPGRHWKKTKTAMRINKVRESTRTSVVDGIKIPHVIAEELLETLRFFGVPDAIIGQSEESGFWNKLKKQCYLRRAKIFEFVPMIADLFVRNKNSRSFSETQNDARRQIKCVMGDAKTILRSTLWSKCRFAVEMAIKNDNEWFDRVAPRKRWGRKGSFFVNDDVFQVRKRVRREIGLMIKNNPRMSRTELWSTPLKGMLLWASKQDREWFDKIMPCAKKIRVAGKPHLIIRRTMRNEIKDAIARGVARSRTELWRKRQTATKWLSIHDKRWLDRTMPTRGLPGNRTSDKT
jgi:hypothetical protein